MPFRFSPLSLRFFFFFRFSFSFFADYAAAFFLLFFHYYAIIDAAFIIAADFDAAAVSFFLRRFILLIAAAMSGAVMLFAAMLRFRFHCCFSPCCFIDAFAAAIDVFFFVSSIAMPPCFLIFAALMLDYFRFDGFRFLSFLFSLCFISPNAAVAMSRHYAITLIRAFRFY